MSLVIATSVRGHEPLAAPVSAGYALAVRTLSHLLPIDVIPPLVTYSDDNYRARNRVAGQVLREAPKATHVLWWDDDTWPEDLRIVREMMASGEDVISAPYTNKRPPVRWTHVPLDPSPPAADGKQEVRSVGWGFTMTTTRCLQRMFDGARKYRDWPHAHVLANMFGALFDPPFGEPCPEDQEMMLSEDRSFCKRWRLMGGRVMLKLDAGIIMHAGCSAWSARDMPGVVE
jgi:hypothetical protein